MTINIDLPRIVLLFSLWIPTTHMNAHYLKSTNLNLTHVYCDIDAITLIPELNLTVYPVLAFSVIELKKSITLKHVYVDTIQQTQSMLVQ